MFTTEMLKEAMESMHVAVDFRDLEKAINGNAFANGLVFGAVLAATALGTWQICEIKRILKKMEQKENSTWPVNIITNNSQPIAEEATKENETT